MFQVSFKDEEIFMIMSFQSANFAARRMVWRKYFIRHSDILVTGPHDTYLNVCVGSSSS